MLFYHHSEQCYFIKTCDYLQILICPTSISALRMLYFKTFKKFKHQSSNNYAFVWASDKSIVFIFSNVSNKIVIMCYFFLCYLLFSKLHRNYLFIFYKIDICFCFYTLNFILFNFNIIYAAKIFDFFNFF